MANEKPREPGKRYKYVSLYEMPDDVMRAFANDLDHAKEAVRRIRAKKKAAKQEGCRPNAKR